jgi:hypothetical protein
VQPEDGIRVERVRAGERMNARGVEGFITVDVAQAGNQALVE